MRVSYVVTGVVLGLWLGLWLATSFAADAVSCDQMVAEQYRGLAADQFLPQPPAASCSEQVQAVGEQVRVVNYQYNLKAQQAVVAEGEVARQREQNRQLRLEIATLKAEVAKLRNGGTAPDKPGN